MPQKINVKGYILGIYSRDLERRLTFKSQGEKNTKMEIPSAIERQMHYFKTQCDVPETENQYYIGFDENGVSLKLLVPFLQDAMKRFCQLCATGYSAKQSTLNTV